MESVPRTSILRDRSARGLALFAGLFTGANLVGEWVRPGFDANGWWIDLRSFPAATRWVLLGAVAAVSLTWVIRPRLSRARRIATRVVFIVAAAIAVWNGIAYYVFLSRGTFTTSFPLPLSLVVAAVLFWLAWSAGRSSPPSRSKVLAASVIVAAGGTAATAFALAQMLCFGQTDYRRPADVIVVFGSRAYADGSLSQSLLDRTRTGCELYQEGFAPKLLFTGGPADAEMHETEAMRRFAVEFGVPASDIVLDRDGVNTRASASSTARIFREREFERVLAVSHGYHLPRVKLAYQRVGIEVYTVPARVTRQLRRLPFFVAREVVALVWYWIWPW